MRVVFLSWSYPPMRAPRAVQVSRLASHMKHRPIEVYCLDQGSDAGAGDPAGIERHPIGLGPPFRVLAEWGGMSLRRVAWRMDVKYGWWRRASARIIGSNGLGPRDILITFGQPMTDHLAGLRIKRHTGVRWVAHFSDPWADNPYLAPRLKARARAWEKAVLEEADLVIFTSTETVDLVMTKYPDVLRKKACTLPHAFDATLYEVSRDRPPRITVRYVGNLFKGRGPEALFAMARRLNEWRPDLMRGLAIELIGEIADEFKKPEMMAGLPSGCVRFVPAVPYGLSLELMTGADLLINIDAPGDTSVFLPSKLVDYIGAGRPILTISPPGAASRLVAEMGGWVASPGDAEHGSHVLGEALEYVAANRGMPWGNDDVRKRYDAVRVGPAFETMIGLA